MNLAAEGQVLGAFGLSIVFPHATGTAIQARVRDALQHSLEAWRQLFDGIRAAT